MRPALPAVTTTSVAVDGVLLFTRRVGDGPPVIVLHGGPGAHHDYLLPQYDLLATGRRLLYYDQRGGGRSPVDRGVPLGWREHVADLEGLRRHWDLERLTLLGYSWGGLLALLYTLEHPARVERVALVASAPVRALWREAFERHLAERAAAPALREAWAALRASDLRLRDAEAYQRQAFALAVAPYFHDAAASARMTPFRITARTQAAVWASLGAYDLRDAWRATFPAGQGPAPCVVHGRYDPLPFEAAEELARLVGTEVRELPTGHAPHVEAPEAFVQLLDPFLPRD